MKKVLLSSALLSLSLTAGFAFAEEQAVPTLYAMPVAISALVAASVIADVVVPSAPEISSVSQVTENTETIRTNNLTAIKARGETLIKQRVNSLASNAASVEKSKTLTAEQKSAFAAFFSTKTSELNALNTKIQAGSDASSTKVLVKSIFTDFRIYGIVIPQIRVQTRIYSLQNHIAKLNNEVFVKVQQNIDAYKAKGRDVTVWQKNLDDTKAVVAADATKLTTLMTTVNALTPMDYASSTSKTTFKAARETLQSVSTDLNRIGRKVRRPENLPKVKVVANASTTVAR